MKISDLIEVLEDLKHEHGDIEVREASDGEHIFNIVEICGEIFIG